MAGTGRALRLLSLLQGRRHWSGADLAERLGVSLRTLRRDVGRLRDLGYPVEATPGVDGGYHLAPGASLPPLMLDDEEAVALVLGLHTAAMTAVAGMAEASVRALAKVVPVLPARLRRRVEAVSAVTVPAPWGGGASIDPGVLTTVAQACRDSTRLAFAYTAAGGERTERLVEPYRLVPLSGRWYLVAFDPARGDWRSFRLDRLADARATGDRYALRRLPAEDVAAFVRAGLGARAAVPVEAHVRAPVEQVRERIGRWAGVVDDGDGGCWVSLQSDAVEWAVFALGSVEAEFTVLSPPELVDRVRQWGERFLRASAADVHGTFPDVGGDRTGR